MQQPQNDTPKNPLAERNPPWRDRRSNRGADILVV